MKRLSAIAGSIVGACLFALSAAAQPNSGSAPPATQTLSNPMVQVAYLQPKSSQFGEIYERVQRYRVLELLQEFLSPLRLPKMIRVATAECGAREIAYVPGEPVVICYEYIREVELLAPPLGFVGFDSPGRDKDDNPLDRRFSRDWLIIGAVTNLVLSKTAFAVLDVLEVPVWGRMEEAADTLAALVMLEFQNHVQVIWSTLAGTSWLLAQRGFRGVGSFSAQNTNEAQRFYNYLCMAIGAHPGEFVQFAMNNNLPEERARRCGRDYRKALRSFMQTIMPSVDQGKLKQVRSLNWAARMFAQSGK